MPPLEQGLNACPSIMEWSVENGAGYRLPIGYSCPDKKGRGARKRPSLKTKPNPLHCRDPWTGSGATSSRPSGKHFRSLVDKGIEQHPGVLTGRKKRTIFQALLRRLHEYRSSVLLFVSDPKVPFTNNEAERGIRMTKLRQKIAGAFRTEEFASLFLGIRSIIGTLKKNDKPIFESLLTLMPTGSLPDLLLTDPSLSPRFILFPHSGSLSCP